MDALEIKAVIGTTTEGHKTTLNHLGFIVETGCLKFVFNIESPHNVLASEWEEFHTVLKFGVQMKRPLDFCSTNGTASLHVEGDKVVFTVISGPDDDGSSRFEIPKCSFIPTAKLVLAAYKNHEER